MADFTDVKEVTKKALQVHKMYYDLLDGGPQERQKLLGMYFTSPQHNLMQWNGHNLSSIEAIGQYLLNLPKTKHHIVCVDAQPLPGNEGADSFFVTISGTCTYDDEHKRYFFQRLVFMSHEAKFYIVNDYLRWTGEV